MLLLIGGVVGTCWVVYQAFHVLDPHMPANTFQILAPPEAGNPQKLHHSYRIFFLKLPSIYTSALCSMLMGASAVLLFLSRKKVWEHLIVACAQIALVSCLVTIVTGYFWGEYAWGRGWNWEPQLTSALILWLSYVALLQLRASVREPRQRQTLTGVYALLTLPLYPLTKYAIEIFGDTGSHPMELRDLLAGGAVASLKSTATLAVMAFYFALLLIRLMQLDLRTRLEAINVITTTMQNAHTPVSAKPGVEA